MYKLKERRVSRRRSIHPFTIKTFSVTILHTRPQPMKILEQSRIEQVEEHVEEIERAQLVALGVQSHEDSIEERDVIELQH